MDKHLPQFGQTIIAYKFKCFAKIALTWLLIISNKDSLALDFNGLVKHSPNQFNSRQNFAPKNMPTSNLANKTYTILLWTKYFEKDKMLKINFADLKCRFTNCRLTSDRALITTADGVLFHWRDMNVTDVPKAHDSSQKWILYNMESPVHSPIKMIDPLIGRIDWTMTYQSESEIYAPYGRVFACDRKNMAKSGPPFRNKTGDIAWLVSNCHTPSKREDYVERLREFIDVDIYGKCGSDTCPKGVECLQKIEREYKFYLSFENSICKDYVTEKLFTYIQYKLIPIVYGGANYSAIMPNHSYIDIMDYSSPKQLAEHLRRIGGDENEYNSYFAWKDRYCVNDDYWGHFCGMCEKFNTAVGDQRSNKSDFIKWFSVSSACNTTNSGRKLNPNPSAFNYKPENAFIVSILLAIVTMIF